MVAGVRLELTTFRVWTGCSSQLSYPAKINGREDRIRTCDPLVPNQVHYQAVLLPENMVACAGYAPAPTDFQSVASTRLAYKPYKIEKCGCRLPDFQDDNRTVLWLGLHYAITQYPRIVSGIRNLHCREFNRSFSNFYFSIIVVISTFSSCDKLSHDR